MSDIQKMERTRRIYQFIANSYGEITIPIVNNISDIEKKIEESLDNNYFVSVILRERDFTEVIVLVNGEREMSFDYNPDVFTDYKKLMCDISRYLQFREYSFTIDEKGNLINIEHKENDESKMNKKFEMFNNLEVGLLFRSVSAYVPFTAEQYKMDEIKKERYDTLISLSKELEKERQIRFNIQIKDK